MLYLTSNLELHRRVVGTLMGTNCAPLVENLLLFCYERDFMLSLSDDKQADTIDAFNTKSRYLDDILNINTIYFDNVTMQSFNLIKQIHLILKPPFWICICSFLMVLILPKFMMIMTTLILKLSISFFRWRCSSF